MIDIIKIDRSYCCGESLSTQEQFMYCESILQAIHNLESRDPELRDEAIDFIFKSDRFEVMLDLVSCEIEFNVEAARLALRKRFFDGKIKSNDGRRNKPTTSCNHDKCKGSSKPAKKPSRIRSVFPGTHY